MIKLRQELKDHSLVEIPFTTTVFPDSTSQIWKVDLLGNTHEINFQILWLFENEAELFHILQLTKLLQVEFKGVVVLDAPYLPYARQDKEISNQTTWALHLLAELLKSSGIKEVTTFDQHSSIYFKNTSPVEFHRAIINHDIICFPDKGARTRYPHLFEKPFVYCDKVRNQLTGQIEGLSLNLNDQELSGKSIIIIDDLCDGGGTFIQVARALKNYSPLSIDLCVSHGLFSNGKQILYDAGINQVFTTNSLLRNPNDFSVWK